MPIAFYILLLAFIGSSEIQGTTLLRSSKGLKKPELKYRYQLNEAEFQDIQKTYAKYFQRRDHPRGWFNEDTLKKIHQEMFGGIWSWAGDYYTGKRRNIGIESSEIECAMKELCSEVESYLKGNTTLSVLEQSARILQKIQYIHPFRNGNGRFARFVSDLYLYSMQGSVPMWPDKVLLQEGEERFYYLFALQKADAGEFYFLTDFIFKYGGRDPSIFEIVESPFFKENFSKSKRKEMIWNQSPQKPLANLFISLI